MEGIPDPGAARSMLLPVFDQEHTWSLLSVALIVRTYGLSAAVTMVL